MSLKGLKILSKYLIRQLGHLDPDDVLGPLGLEKRRSTASRFLPAVGLFGLGLAAGFGAGFLLSAKVNEMIAHHDAADHQDENSSKE